jgi:hypothetical protein
MTLTTASLNQTEPSYYIWSGHADQELEQEYCSSFLLVSGAFLPAVPEKVLGLQPRKQQANNSYFLFVSSTCKTRSQIKIFFKFLLPIFIISYQTLIVNWVNTELNGCLVCSD